MIVLIVDHVQSNLLRRKQLLRSRCPPNHRWHFGMTCSRMATLTCTKLRWLPWARASVSDVRQVALPVSATLTCDHTITTPREYSRPSSLVQIPSLQPKAGHKGSYLTFTDENWFKVKSLPEWGFGRIAHTGATAARCMANITTCACCSVLCMLDCIIISCFMQHEDGMLLNGTSLACGAVTAAMTMHRVTFLCFSAE